MSLYLGIMSGTSLDGIDIALVDQDQKTSLIAHHYLPIPGALRTELLALCTSGIDELERIACVEPKWTLLAAEAIEQLLERERLDPQRIRAIGSHGQTIRHIPEQGFSLQIGNPALLAEKTGIPVVSHFRQRDLAAGGQGAPLVPAFHAALFKEVGQSLAVLNIGGFSNISLLVDQQPVQGCDCGPGNVLLDAWIHNCKGQQYDLNGSWAQSGSVRPDLLAQLLHQPFFSRKGPKSTGRELFNLAWLQEQLLDYPSLSTEDVQATLLQVTVDSIAQSLRTFSTKISTVLVCGGGAHNIELMKRLQIALPDCELASTAARGVPPDWVEAMAFAWLAHCCLEKISANCPSVTGARGLRVLGAVYPA